MRVLLLGASGLLGHNTLHCLMDSGHRVVALVRRAGALCVDGDYEVRLGSLLDYATLRAAAEGCDAIVNCAGVTDMSLLHYEDYLPVNRDLCGMLAQLLDDLGINILVHTSTVNTIDEVRGSEFGSGKNEVTPKCLTTSWYAVSKREGEQLVLAAARKEGRHVVVVNAGYMLGPWDVKPSSGRMLQAGYRRRVMAAPGGGKSFVHVGDVAQALVNALTMGRNGSRYIAVNSDANMSIKELYQLQASVMGYRQRVLLLPDWLLGLAGRVGDALRSVGLRTDVSTVNVRQLMVCEHYSAARTVNELQMPQTPIAEAIRQFHSWYAE